jgi:hypothetical protein
MRRAANIMLIVAFALLLWLPTVDTLLHLDHTTAFNEKRLPAQFPDRKPGIKGLQEYTQGLEAYFNDHFGFRNQLIHWHLLCQIAVFKAEATRDVVLGQDGWLFYSGEGTREDKQSPRGKGFSQQELTDYQHLLERRRDWLAQRGITYVFVVAPDKQSIYPEHLRAGAKPAKTKLDQFVEHMHSHSTVTVPDLRPALREAKRVAPTYFKTDSHWNHFGGFIACQEIVKALSKQVPGSESLSLDSFELKRTDSKGGDLAEMLGVQAAEKNVALVPKPGLPALVETVQNPNFVCPTYFTTNTSAAGKVIVFRDSFGTALIPFLGYHFAEAAYFWNMGDFDVRTIEQTKPTVVISEVVERHFNNTDASKRLQTFAR